MVNHELIVPSNKEATKTGLMVAPFMIVMAGYLWYVSFDLRPFVGNLITHVIQSIWMLTLILFVIGFIYNLFMQKNNDPAARLSPEGIWIKHFGFIPWLEIDHLDEYAVSGTPLVGIGIRVKNLNLLAKQASLSGKLGIFWSKIFGYPPIIISNIALDNEQIIIYARRYKPV